MPNFELPSVIAVAQALDPLVKYVPPARRSADQELLNQLRIEEGPPADAGELAELVVQYAGLLPPFLLEEDQLTSFVSCMGWAIDRLLAIGSPTEIKMAVGTAAAFVSGLPQEPTQRAALQYLEVISLEWSPAGLMALLDLARALDQFDAAASLAERLGRRLGTSLVDLDTAADRMMTDEGTAAPLADAGDTTDGSLDEPTQPDNEPLSEGEHRLDQPAEPPAANTNLATPDGQSAPGSVDTAWIQTHAITAATAIGRLASHAIAERRADNQRLADSLRDSPPDIADASWAALATLAGVYARHFDLVTLRREEVEALWSAVRWSVAFEAAYRIKSVSQRFNQLTDFLGHCPHQLRGELVERDADQLATLIPHAKSKALTQFVDALESDERLAVIRLVDQGRARLAAIPRLDQQLSPSVTGPMAGPMSASQTRAILLAILHTEPRMDDLIDALDRVWGFLDSRRENDNRRKMTAARNGDRHAVAALGIAAARSGAYRLGRNNRPASLPPNARFQDLAHLALFAAHQGVVDKAEGLTIAITLVGLHHLVTQSGGPDAYVALVKAAIDHAPEYSDRLLLHAVTQASTLLGGDASPESAQHWLTHLGSTSYLDITDKQALRNFLARVEAAGVSEGLDLLALRQALQQDDNPAARGGVSFMSAKDAEAFEDHYRRGHVYEMAELLEKHTDPLLGSLSRTLASSSFDDYRAPGQRVRIPQGGEDKFPEYRRKAQSGDAAAAREARDAFDRAQSAVHAKQSWTRKVLREWRVFAAMRADSVLSAVPEWVEAFNSKTASTEEIWNLGVFHASSREYARALSFLAPRVLSLTAPYEHLVFAFYLAIQVLRTGGTAAETEEARSFLIANARLLTHPQAQLLWVALAQNMQPRPDLSELSARVYAYKQLMNEPLEVPQPTLPSWTKDRRRLQAELEALRARLTKFATAGAWRLWLNGFLPRNRDWVKAWEWMAIACEETNDVNEAVTVLRDAARQGFREYERASRGKTGQDSQKAKDSAVRFLRQTLARLCRLARSDRRDNLLREVYETWVREVPELLVREGRNRELHEQLRDFLPEHTPEPPPQPPGGAAIWSQLIEVLFHVHELEQLDTELQNRLDNALQVDPGSSGRGAVVTAPLRDLLTRITELRDGGVDKTDLPVVVNDLGERIQHIRRDVEQRELTQLRALLEALNRVLRAFARMASAVPVPEVSLPSSWLGFPDDVEDSSVLLEIRNPGPGAVTNLVVTGTWVEYPDHSTAQANQLQELGPEHTTCSLLVMSRPGGALAPSIVTCHIGLQYDWGIVRGVEEGVEIDVPMGDFSTYLADQGLSAREFPDPFVADVPLAREQVGSALFQGRVQEVQLISSTYCRHAPPQSPVCFFGIRRTGKTSLLRKVATELQHHGLQPLEVSLLGLRATQMSMRELVLGFLHTIADASRDQYPDVGFSADVPIDHPSPMLLVKSFFAELARAHGDSLVVLLDEFQQLDAPAGEPLLDALRFLYEARGASLIMFANQGQAVEIDTGSQLALDSRRVDFLSFDETCKLISEPLAAHGVLVHPSATSTLFEYTAGHPNFTVKIVKVALERLNIQHRNIVVPDDIHDGAQRALAAPGPFTVSWFSRQNLNDEEEDTAIRFAKAAHGRDGLTLEELASSQFELRVLRQLEAKMVLKVIGERAMVRGRLLQEYLESRIGVFAAPKVSPERLGDRVGLFIDLENLEDGRIRTGLNGAAFGELLRAFAAQFGVLKCSWAFAKPWSFPDWFSLKISLEETGVEVSEVPPELRRPGKQEKNIVDMMLNDQIKDESEDKNLTVLVLVTGDVDHYAMVKKNLGRGLRVHVVGESRESLAKVYGALADERRRQAVIDGRTEVDLSVRLLDDVLRNSRATHT